MHYKCAILYKPNKNLCSKNGSWIEIEPFLLFNMSTLSLKFIKDEIKLLFFVLFIFKNCSVKLKKKNFLKTLYSELNIKYPLFPEAIKRKYN